MIMLDDSALLASEGKALLESGWWSDYSNLTSLRCNWTGTYDDQKINGTYDDQKTTMY